MMNGSDVNPRYGVEIKVPTLHVECQELQQVLTLLERHTGMVRVFDRHSRELVADGTVHDARESLGALTGRFGAANLPLAQIPADGPVAGEGFQKETGGTKVAKSYAVQIPEGLNIASAYYFGDLGSITRSRDSNGNEKYYRSMLTRLRPEPETS